jgi:2-polyprenyl-3-methyl-5-hydroxy-6-metoxy-1,4-benzoquinol methylase
MVGMHELIARGERKGIEYGKTGLLLRWNNALVREERDWEILARRDPCWAILSSEHYDVPAFRATGVSEAQRLARRFEDVTSRRASDARALDYGCGLGRLTVPMLEYFDRVAGYDISPSMIAGARAYAEERYPGSSRVSFDVVLAPGSIGRTSAFDLVLANLVLQHMPGRLAVLVLGELVEAMAPGGLLLANFVESRSDSRFLPTPLRRAAHRAAAPVHLASRIGLYPLERSLVEAELRGLCSWLTFQRDDAACDGWSGYWLIAIRSGSSDDASTSSGHDKTPDAGRHPRAS